MGTDNKEKIETLSGRILEAYKIWYLRQPKFLRIAVFPLSATLSAIFLSTAAYHSFWFLIPLGILCFGAYNQHIEAISVEETKKELEENKKTAIQWERSFEQLLHLNNVLKELVNDKSEIFLQTINVAQENSKAEAIATIRKQGSYTINLMRIMGALHSIFEKQANIQSNQVFRVSYLIPQISSNAKETRLITWAWYNKERVPPKSSSKDFLTDYFKLGGNTVAGHL